LCGKYFYGTDVTVTVTVKAVLAYNRKVIQFTEASALAAFDLISFHHYRHLFWCIICVRLVAEICGLFQCDLNCELGYARGPAGCLKCECADPCQVQNKLTTTTVITVSCFASLTRLYIMFLNSERMCNDDSAVNTLLKIFAFYSHSVR